MVISIFLIEDDDIDAEQLERVLKKNHIHYNLSRSVDGQGTMEYLETFLNQPFSNKPLILMDLNLPLLSGHTLLNKIAKNFNLAHINLLIVTTSNAPKDLALKAHPLVKGYICKADLMRTLPQVIFSLYYQGEKLDGQN